MTSCTVSAVYLRCDEPCENGGWKAVRSGLEQAARCGARSLLIKASRLVEPDLIARAVDLCRGRGFSIRFDVALDDNWDSRWRATIEKGVSLVLHIPPEALPGVSLQIPRSLARDLTVYVEVEHRNQGRLEDVVRTLLASIGVSKVVLFVTMRHGLGSSEYLSLCSRVRALAVQYPGQIWARMPWVLLDGDTWRVSRRLCDYSHTIGLRLDGGIVPCGAKRRAEDGIPTVCDARLEEILRFDPFMAGFRDIVLPDDVQGVCRRCVFSRYCANICPAYVYNTTGSFTESYPECQQLLADGLFPECCLLENREADQQKGS